MNDDRRHGQRAGIRWCITWLHKRADEMNDPKARDVLNSAAFNLSNAARGLQIVEAPSEEDRT